MVSPKQEIQLELESHLLDKQAELVSQGKNPKQAEQEARELFGDLESHLQSTLAARNLTSHFFHPTSSLLVLSLSGFLLSGLLFRVFTAFPWPLMIEQLFVWSGFLSLAALGLCLTRLLIEYFGLKQLSVVSACLVMSVLMSFSVTSLLDLNNFEVTIHLSILAVLVGMALKFSWKKIHLSLKYLILYAFNFLAIFLAATERLAFEFIATLRCSFIQPDSIPLTGELANCQQLPLWHPLLIVLYLVVLGGGGYLVAILWNYLKNSSTPLYKRVLLTASFATMSVMPLAVPNLNKHGELDIVRWKVEIYSAYEDVLGRDPEQKDLEFYARSHAYQDMVRLKDVLYASAERKLKIDLLYQEILRRPATLDEIQRWNQQQATVEEIRDWLNTQHQ